MQGEYMSGQYLKSWAERAAPSVGLGVVEKNLEKLDEAYARNLRAATSNKNGLRVEVRCIPRLVREQRWRLR